MSGFETHSEQRFAITKWAKVDCFSGSKLSLAAIEYSDADFTRDYNWKRLNFTAPRCLPRKKSGPDMKRR